MVWPTLGSRTAKEQNRTVLSLMQASGFVHNRLEDSGQNIVEQHVAQLSRRVVTTSKYQLSLTDPRDVIVLSTN